MAAGSSSEVVTYPNVRVASSNVKEISEGSRVDVRFYNVYFDLVNECCVKKKFCCPLAINTSEDGKIVHVETHGGFALAFFVDHYYQSRISNEFELLQMLVVKWNCYFGT